MKFIIPLIDRDYYLWQCLCQIMNFRELGYEQDAVYPVVYWNKPSARLQSFLDSINIKAKFYPYNDTRTMRNYSASLKPWLMYKYFRDNPNDEVWVYADADVIFPRAFDFTPFENIKHKFYGSDTKSYSGVQYIKGKGEQLFYELCNLGLCDAKEIEATNNFEIGAQYIFQGTDAAFWFDVYEKSSLIYKHCEETKTKYKPENDYSIQSWCSELYYTQWAAIKFGYNPETTDRLSFSWSNWKRSDWEKFPIWHNAGNTVEDGKHFCKITHQVSPFKKELKVSEESISVNYVDLIRRTEKEFPELIW